MTSHERLDEAGQPEELALFNSLPDWLIAIVQPETVRRAIAQAIPAFATGRRILRRCEIMRMRMKKDSWTGIYQLTIAAPDGAEQRLQLQGTLRIPGKTAPVATTTIVEPGEDGWQYFVPDLRLQLSPWSAEAALPALAILTDPEQAADLLELSMRSAAPKYHNLAIDSCIPRVARNKPGSRCTIVYDLTYAHNQAAGWPTFVVAKTHKGSKGKNSATAIFALWASPLGKSTTAKIAEPLGYVPDLNMVIQGPVREEQMLKDLIRSALRTGTPEALADLSSVMRKTAAGMAELHCSGVQSGEIYSWEDAFGEILETVDQLGLVFPQLKASIQPLLSRVSAQAETHPADAQVPSHGSFRPAQVLLAGAEIAFIDFDSFCQAEPAFDLALFLSATKNIGLSEPHEEESSEDDTLLDPQTRTALLDQLDVICEEFLAEYELHAPVSRQRIALWETIELLDLVLSCWTKIKPARLSNTLTMLERHMKAALR